MLGDAFDAYFDDPFAKGIFGPDGKLPSKKKSDIVDDKVMTPGAPDMYEPDSADVAKIMNYNKGNNDKEVSTDSVDSTKSGVTKGDGMNDNDDGNDVGDSKEDNDEKKRKEDAMNLDDSVDDIENFILDDSEDGNDVGDTDSVEAGKPVGDVLVEPKKRKSNSQDDNDVLEDVLE